MIKSKVEKTCINCGSIFETWKHREETAKFCSRGCYHEGQKKGITTHPKRIYVEFICKTCGERFERQKRGYGAGTKLVPQYCSVKCYNEMRGTYYRAQSHKAKREREIKFSICEICGYKRFVEISHIVPNKDGGSYEKYNILFLCPNHHRLFDRNLLTEQETGKIMSRTKLAYEIFNEEASIPEYLQDA